MGWFDKPEPEVPGDDLMVVISPYNYEYACRLYKDNYLLMTKFARTRWGARRVSRRMLRDQGSEYREEIRA